MAPFYGCASTVSSRIQSHYQETVHSLLLGPQEYLVLILSTWKERRLSQHGNHSLILTLLWEPLLGIQHLNHKATASTVDRKILGSNPIYMVDPALKPDLISRLAVIFGLFLRKRTKKGKILENLGKHANILKIFWKSPHKKINWCLSGINWLLTNIMQF